MTVCAAFPLVDADGARWLLDRAGGDHLRVLLGPSPINEPARELLLEAGAEVRVLPGLHAKLLIVGELTAVETSANLTRTGMGNSREVTWRLARPAAASDFEAMWGRALD